jgi:hypothetical protein
MKNMKIYIDNIGKIGYLSLSMQNLKVIKVEIENKIQALNQELEVINRALEIQSKHSSTKSEVIESDLEQFKNGNAFPEPEEIEKAILGIKESFKAEDVPAFVVKTFPHRTKCSKNAVATGLYQLIKNGKLEYVRKRAGRRPAIYRVKQKH